jgi:hypothetical protein
MTTEEQAPPELAAAASALLASSLGGGVRLDAGRPLSGRDHVFRFALREGPAGAPASVIVKCPRPHDGAAFNPDDAEGAAPLLFDDWAALQFLSAAAADAPVAPRYLAGERASGLLVIEDLGAGESIDAFLLGADAPEAEQALVELARTLGRMHARTAGRQDEYNRLRDALGPRSAHSRGGDTRALGPKFLQSLQTLGVEAPAGLGADLDAVIAAMTDPGPFLAYTHGDPCPDNCLRVDGRIRLIDFEVGGFRHALTDGVYGRIHFPTCWCVNRLPGQLPPRMEAVYRSELAQGCPAAADDALFRRGVVEACAFWGLVTCLGWYDLEKMLEEDRTWGISTQRQRVLLRAPIVARLAAEAGYLEALGVAFAALAERLRALWPPEAAEMPLYPAWRES